MKEARGLHGLLLVLTDAFIPRCNFFPVASAERFRLFQMKTASLLLMLVCVAGLAWSQGPSGDLAKPEMPDGPLLRSVPDYSQWKITFSYPDKTQKKRKSIRRTKAAPISVTARVRKIVITKTGRIVHEEQTDVFDQTTSKWYDGGTQYTKFAQDSTWYQSDPSTKGASAAVAYQPFPSTGYRDMELVTEVNYAGITSYDNRKCLVFTPGGYLKLDLSKVNDTKKVPAVAMITYVDADNRLPVATQTPEAVRKFDFEQPPTKVQELPSDLVKQLKNGTEANTRLSQPAPRPY